jgi:hypothetical protein
MPSCLQSMATQLPIRAPPTTPNFHHSTYSGDSTAARLHSTHSASTATVNTNNPAHSLTLFTCRVLLTFGLAVCKEVNVEKLFTQWFESAQGYPQIFSLLPYDSDKGPTITSPSQLTSTDEELFYQYFSKHRIHQHGILTGMVQFQTSSLWKVIKGYKSPYFSWLKSHCIFLKYT